MDMVKKFFTTLVLAFLLVTVSVPASLLSYTNIEAATVGLDKKTLYVYVGNTYSLHLNGISGSASWSSSNKKVATVSTKGKVTGVKAGSATITAKVGSKKYSCKVTVKSPNISAKNFNLVVGSKEEFKLLGATDKVTWKSSNTSAATISSKGIVTAKEEGLTKITSTYKNKSYSCTVKVVPSRIQASATDITCNKETQIKILITDYQYNEDIYFDVGDENIANCEWGDWLDTTEAIIPLKIIPNDYGTTQIKITSTYSNEELIINVKVADVDNITYKNSKKLTAEEVNKKCSISTVQVNTDSGIGSGFFIDDNTVVTNYHVIAGATSLNIQLKDGSTYDVDKILGYDKKLDIALLSVPVTKIPLIINQHGVNSGETVYAIGSSLGLQGTFTKGIVTNASRIMDDVEYIQTDVAITYGNSGGPLLNSYGEVMGINNGGYDGKNLNFAINIDQISKVNTEYPITASEFYKNNSSISNIVYYDVAEDSSVSNDINTCQTLTSGADVIGSIDTYDVDFYKFTLSTDQVAFLFAGARSGDIRELEHVNFYIADSNGNLLYVAEPYVGEDGNTYLVIKQKFSAGTYYIAVVPDSDIEYVADYEFVLATIQ